MAIEETINGISQNSSIFAIHDVKLSFVPCPNLASEFTFV